MTITTKNTNPKNDSKFARHRSITKGNQNRLEDVFKALRGQQGVQFRHFHDTPSKIREEWYSKFNQGLPKFNSDTLIFKGTAGLGEWLGPNSPFLTDVKAIWQDFAKIFVRRSDDNDKTVQHLFVSYTSTNFDLIYSKWGITPGHKFFHWASVADNAPKKRATIDDFVDADDQGDDENAM
jgi:hypothetical protein